MQSTFILNLVDRPEMAPEYAQKTTQSGKQDNVSASALNDESLQIFVFQQQAAHAFSRRNRGADQDG